MPLLVFVWLLFAPQEARGRIPEPKGVGCMGNSHV